VYRSQHEPILSRTLFEAVQAKLAANAVDRQIRLKGSAAILAGRLYDDRGNRMSPTHANKKGVRYRYYVSHALLQNRKPEAGSIARVPAPEVESLVYDGVRRQLAAIGRTEPANSLTDRELIERYVARVIIKPEALDVCMIHSGETRAQAEDPGLDVSAPCPPQTTTIALPRTAPSFAAVKGTLHEPSEKPTMKPESRDALLTATAKARKWIDDIRLGRFASFAEIAEREAVGERRIRYWHPSRFSHPASLPQSSMAPRLRILRSPASPKPCPIHEPSRSRGLGSVLSSGEHSSTPIHRILWTST
jgi:site-specific DNA recombinase